MKKLVFTSLGFLIFSESAIANCGNEAKKAVNGYVVEHAQDGCACWLEASDPLLQGVQDNHIIYTFETWIKDISGRPSNRSMHQLTLDRDCTNPVITDIE